MFQEPLQVREIGFGHDCSIRFEFDPRLLHAGIKGGLLFTPVWFPDPGRYVGVP